MKLKYSMYSRKMGSLHSDQLSNLTLYFTLNYLVVENTQNHGLLHPQKGFVDEGDLFGEGGELVGADVLLEHHDIVEVEFPLAIDLDVAEVGVVNELVEGVLGGKSGLVGWLLGVAHLLTFQSNYYKRTLE